VNDPVRALGPAPRGPDGRFRNPPGSPTPGPGRRASFLRFLWRQLSGRGMPPVPTVPEGHALTTDATLAGLADLTRRDCITWLGHAAFLVRLGGRTLLLDPYLEAYAGPLALYRNGVAVRGLGPRRYVDSPIPVARLPEIDAVLISHNHYDHLDAATLARLPGKRRSAVIVPRGLATHASLRAFADRRELDWGETTRLGELAVTAVPAVHFSRRGLFDRNRTLWCGFVLETAAKRIFFSGDTAHGEVFAEIGRAFGGFDLALIGIGAYAPREVMRASHATPEEAVRIGRDLGARHVMGMHWGTVALTMEPAFEAPGRFRAAARDAGYAEEQAWIMRVGETRDIPYGAAARRNRADG